MATAGPMTSVQQKGGFACQAERGRPWRLDLLSKALLRAWMTTAQFSTTPTLCWTSCSPLLPNLVPPHELLFITSFARRARWHHCLHGLVAMSTFVINTHEHGLQSFHPSPIWQILSRKLITASIISKSATARHVGCSSEAGMLHSSFSHTQRNSLQSESRMCKSITQIRNIEHEIGKRQETGRISSTESSDALLPHFYSSHLISCFESFLDELYIAT